MARGGTRRLRRLPLASAVAGEEAAAWALVVGHHVLVHRAAPPQAHAALNGVVAVAALRLSHRAGLSTSELGLAREHLGAGLRLGTGVGAAVAAVTAAGARAAPNPAALADDRVSGHSRRRAAGEVLVRIPFATALTEELVHRGALLGLLTRRLGPGGGLAASSLAFGLAHVLPARAAVDASAAGRTAAARRGGLVATIAGTVTSTAAAGAGFAWLRRRSGSVVAPALVHAAANVSGFLVARWAAGHRPQEPSAASGPSG